MCMCLCVTASLVLQKIPKVYNRRNIIYMMNFSDCTLEDKNKFTLQ